MEFDNVVAEAAYELAGHGFALGEVGSVEQGAWHALVDYSPVLLRNVGADADLISRLDRATNSRAGVAWIIEDSQGFVHLKSAALTAFGVPVISEFEAFESKWEEFVG